MSNPYLRTILGLNYNNLDVRPVVHMPFGPSRAMHVQRRSLVLSIRAVSESQLRLLLPSYVMPKHLAKWTQRSSRTVTNSVASEYGSTNEVFPMFCPFLNVSDVKIHESRDVCLFAFFLRLTCHFRFPCFIPGSELLHFSHSLCPLQHLVWRFFHCLRYCNLFVNQIVMNHWQKTFFGNMILMLPSFSFLPCDFFEIPKQFLCHNFLRIRTHNSTIMLHDSVRRHLPLYYSRIGAASVTRKWSVDNCSVKQTYRLHHVAILLVK